ncbi:MAG: hypothetical protein QOG31_1413 [Thermoplasmata archaeon]|nr:hypothetical protein [Thermoplasmata archaeon]
MSKEPRTTISIPVSLAERIRKLDAYKHPAFKDRPWSYHSVSSRLGRLAELQLGKATSARNKSASSARSGVEAPDGQEDD